MTSFYWGNSATLFGVRRELRPWMWGQLGGTFITHVLLMLFTHWSAAVKVVVLHLPAKNVGLARAVLVWLTNSASSAVLDSEILINIVIKNMSTHAFSLVHPTHN